MISTPFLLLYLIYSFSFSCYITGGQNCSCLCLTSACHKPLSSELYSSQPYYSHILLFCLRICWTEVQLAGNISMPFYSLTHMYTHNIYLYIFFISTCSLLTYQGEPPHQASIISQTHVLLQVSFIPFLFRLTRNGTVAIIKEPKKHLKKLGSGPLLASCVEFLS